MDQLHVNGSSWFSLDETIFPRFESNVKNDWFPCKRFDKITSNGYQLINSLGPSDAI